MKALVLHGIGDLRLEDVATPKPCDDEVLVKVVACGVCGSDIPRIFSKGTYHFPTIPGHEFAGTVAEATGDLSKGDPVVAFPLLWCGQCASCERGRYVQCENYGYLGSRNDGGFAEYAVVPRRNLLQVPRGVDLEAASMTEPASVALHALRRVGTNLLGLTVAVFGIGPIGLMVAQWARAMGAREILLFDVAPSKIAKARELGFNLVFNSKDEDPVQAVESRGGAHVCVEAAGVPATVLAACSSVRNGGSVVLLGNPSRDVNFPLELISKLMRKEACLMGTWNSDYSVHRTDDDWRTTLEAIAEHQLVLGPLISHRVSLEDASTKLKLMRDCPEVCSKILILP